MKNKLIAGLIGFALLGAAMQSSSGAVVSEIAILIPKSWDSLDGVLDNKVTYTGWTDVRQRLRFDGQCAEGMANCVPIIMRDVPVGYAAFRFMIQEIYQADGKTLVPNMIENSVCEKYNVDCVWFAN